MSETKLKFRSKYGADRDIGAGQKIAEIIIERMALKTKSKLPNKFWELREWKAKFLYQLMLANGLLKHYDYKAIENSLNCKEGSGIISLKASWLPEILEREQRKISEIKILASNNKPEETAKPAENFIIKKKDMFDELENL
jgi:hypothetical protein